MTDLASVFACPKCQGALTRTDTHLACTGCPGRYELVAGDIPIFLDPAERPSHVPDPGIPFQAAIDLANKLHATPGSFHDLVDAYYEALRGNADPKLFDYYRNITKNRALHPISDEVRMIQTGLPVVGAPFPQVRLALEFGCGWGFSLAAFAVNRIINPNLRKARLCGFDLNPAILAVAQRLFRDLELPGITLAVANATKTLPFPARSVDLIYSNGVVEHIPDQDGLMQAMGGALSADSVLHFLIPNRYMVHPEPHFAVRWVGFLPRKYHRRYVGYRLGLPAAHVEQILSYAPSDLASLMGRHFPNDLLYAVPCRPSDGPLWQRALHRGFGRFGINRYHCVVRRYPGTTPTDALRGKLQLTSIFRGRPLTCAKVYDAPRAAA